LDSNSRQWQFLASLHAAPAPTPDSKQKINVLPVSKILISAHKLVFSSMLGLKKCYNVPEES
jgi:hypothetical protein